VQYLTIWDLVLAPVYLLILAYIAKRHRDKAYPVGHPLRPYYLKGLYVKFAGAIFIAIIYGFYYDGGDTYNYFAHAKTINSALNDSFSTWFNLILAKSPNEYPELYKYSSQMFWYNASATYTVAVIAAIFGLLNGTAYIPIALLFAYFAYSGIWAMFKTFVRLYPGMHKQLAIAFLFVPSVVVWSSSVFKDTICMFGLGWMTHTTFQLFVNRNFSVKNMLAFALSFYLVAVVKIYILLDLSPP
jgi:hypothetical protein